MRSISCWSLPWSAANKRLQTTMRCCLPQRILAERRCRKVSQVIATLVTLTQHKQATQIQRQRESKMSNPSQSQSQSAMAGGEGQQQQQQQQRRRGGSLSSTAPTPCCSKVGMKRGPWTAEEDEVLASFVRREGEGRWRTLPKRAGLLRCGKSCRLRWMNYLRPSIKRGPITPDEEDLILRLHRLLGNRWSLIAGRIPGRTDNEIKNYWNTHLSKKLIKQGIDPRTHRPFAATADPDPAAPSLPRHTPSANPNYIPPSAPQEPVVDAGAGEGFAVNPHHHHDDFGWQYGEGYRTYASTGDAFSDLLDSFINEDIFLHQQINHNINSVVQDGDHRSVNDDRDKHVEMNDAPAGTSSAPSFGLEGIWEDAFNYFG
ncbi:hypothetical protein Cni_G02556 [Canna indica]|uniref:Uncharacterized protein n=1 Tax=Canna indica TaxID=4628 RepID=A0AAQ3Q014_9LILI|nr:hypothetical protein Cni_G02556 [Canna indica]